MKKKDKNKKQTEKKPAVKIKVRVKAAKKQKSEPALSPQKKKKIVFVCTGNTCRSPMAQYLMCDYLKATGLTDKYTADSAGTDAFQGEDMAANAKETLKEMGIKPPRHKSKNITQAMLRSAGLIVCMTSAHKDAIARLSKHQTKCVTVKELTGGNEVTDPYGQDLDAYRQTAQYLKYSMEETIKYIENSSSGKGSEDVE